jgi:cytochrome c oxidase subunit II
MSRCAGFSVLVLLMGSVACQHHSNESTGVDGAVAFASTCARCHGTDGCGALASTPVGTPRRLCDSAFQASISDAQIKQTILKGKGMMPGFGDDYSEAQVTALVHHVRSLKAAK